MSTEKTIPILTAIELRVLGSLIEKSKTTPDYYPMTLNALTAACNQKTSRKPVVEYDEPTVVIALNNLKSQSLVSTAVGGSIRSVKYKHNFATVFPVSNAELAILCLLFLRGPQTPGELNTNSARLYEFRSLEEIHEILTKLSEPGMPFVKELPKRAGQKEVRFTHLMGENTEEEEENVEEPARRTVNDLETRIGNLEHDVTQLKTIVDKLAKELLG